MTRVARFDSTSAVMRRTKGKKELAVAESNETRALGGFAAMTPPASSVAGTVDARAVGSSSSAPSAAAAVRQTPVIVIVDSDSEEEDSVEVKFKQFELSSNGDIVEMTPVLIAHLEKIGAIKELRFDLGLRMELAVLRGATPTPLLSEVTRQACPLGSLTLPCSHSQSCRTLGTAPRRKKG